MAKTRHFGKITAFMVSVIICTVPNDVTQDRTE